MNDDIKFERKDVTGATVDGDLILFDPEAGKYFATGEVGADIWAQLQTPMSVGELCIRMASDYDVDPDICRKDVEEFVEKLFAAGLVAKLATS